MNKKVKILLALSLSFVFLIASGVIANAVYQNSQDDGFYALSQEVLVVKQGSRGETVKKIQQKLKRWGYYNGAVDGIYGKQTKAAVIYFQKRNGLVADGIVGKKTLAALGISSSSLGGQSGTGGGGK